MDVSEQRREQILTAAETVVAHKGLDSAAIAVASVVEGTMALWMYDRTMIEPARHLVTGCRVLLSMCTDKR